MKCILTRVSIPSVENPSFSRKSNKVLATCRRLGVDMLLDEMTPEQIEGANRRSLLDNPQYRKISHKEDRNVYSKTFIIPVEDGQVTGYFFEKPAIRTGAGLKSLIVFFHSGGWMLGNMDKHILFCNHICSVTGASVLSVDYRLSPAFRFPTALHDCYATLEWASRGARYWGIDPDRIYLMGDCAGGNLAIGVSRLSRDQKGPRIAGQILFCPVTDCRMRTKSYEEFADGPVLSAKTMNFFIKNYQREPKDILDPEFSPMLSKDLSRLPPTLIITADHDVLCDDGRIFAQALEEADTPVKLLQARDTFHGFYHYPKATGTSEVDNALRLFFRGRSLKNIELLTNAQMRKQKDI